MRTIIAGSRGFSDYKLMLATIAQHNISVIISGGARGADMLGEHAAKELNIPLEIYPAQWQVYGKRAGFIRNMQMAEVAEQAILFWDGVSPGTKHMRNIALGKNLKLTVINS